MKRSFCIILKQLTRFWSFKLRKKDTFLKNSLLFLILFIAFLLRYFDQNFFTIFERWDNYHIYLQSAIKILENPFSFDGRLPFYPYFLAFFMKYFYFSYEGLRILNIAINLITGLFGFIFIKKIFSSRAAFVFLFVWAFDPRQIHSSNVLMTENLYTFLVFVSITSFIYSFWEKKYFFLSFFAAGISFLIRSPFWFFYPFLSALFFLISKRNHAIHSLKVFALATFIFLSWGFFWFSLSGRFQGPESPAAVNLLEASMGIEKSLTLKKSDIDGLSYEQIKRDAYEKIKKNPLLYISSTIKRFSGFLFQSMRILGDRPYAYFFIVLSLVFFSFYRLSKADDRAFLTAVVFICFIFYYSIAHSFFSYMDRFTYVTDPYVISFISLLFIPMSKHFLYHEDRFIFNKLMFILPFIFFLPVFFMMFAWPILVKRECSLIKESASFCKEINDKAVSLIIANKKNEAEALLQKNFQLCEYNLEFRANYAYIKPELSDEILKRSSFICSKCFYFLDLKDKEICRFR